MFDYIGRALVLSTFIYAMFIRKRETIELMRQSQPFTYFMIILFLAAIVAVLWW